MSAPVIAFWVVTVALGVAGLAWGVHLRRSELRAPSQFERLTGGVR